MDAPSQHSRVRRRIAVILVVFTMGIVTGTIAVAVTRDDTARDTAATASAMTFAEGDSRYPNESAADWKTYADYVLVVSAINDSPVRVDGSPMSLRDVTLRVSDLLWSSPRAPVAAPKTMQYLGPDTRELDGKRVKVAASGAPQVEPGHTYLMAVHWEAARCSEGDIPDPAHFAPLGDQAIVPFDDSTVGVGEFEGRSLLAADAIAHAVRVPAVIRSLAERHAGEPVDPLLRELQAAKPVARVQFRPPSPCD